MGQQGEAMSSSSWLLPMVIVSVVVLLCGSATAAMVYIHRERIKSSLNNHSRGSSRPQAGGQTVQHSCKLHLPSALITLTSQSPRFRIKLARGNPNTSRSQTCETLNRDFQGLGSPISSSSMRCSYRTASTDDLCKSQQQRLGLKDESEGGFLEIGPKGDHRLRASADSIWIERKSKANLKQDSRRKKKHFIYATMRRIRLCSGIHQSKTTEAAAVDNPEGKWNRRHRSGLVIHDKRIKRVRRGESEEESDYAYIDRSTHSITGYLNLEAKNGQNRKSFKDSSSAQRSLSTFMPMVEHQIDDDDPMSPYATTQVLLSHQQMMDPLGQQVKTKLFHHFVYS